VVVPAALAPAPARVSGGKVGMVKDWRGICAVCAVCAAGAAVACVVVVGVAVVAISCVVVFEDGVCAGCAGAEEERVVIFANRIECMFPFLLSFAFG